jgi:hypothetical protein
VALAAGGSGFTGAALATAAKRWPHFLQNFAPGRFGSWQ